MRPASNDEITDIDNLHMLQMLFKVCNIYKMLIAFLNLGVNNWIFVKSYLLYGKSLSYGCCTLSGEEGWAAKCYRNLNLQVLDSCEKYIWEYSFWFLKESQKPKYLTNISERERETWLELIWIGWKCLHFI